MGFVIWDEVESNFIKSQYNSGAEHSFETEEQALKTYPDSTRYTIIEKSDDEWCLREGWRFEDREYTKPVWYKEPWYNKRKYVIKTFDHVDRSLKSDYIYYTENEKKGQKDVQSSIKPGKFLQRYFSDILSPEQIQYWANVHRETYGTGQELKWARTPEEIEHVYSMESGFDSCMQVLSHEWHEDIGHPTRVYGAGDLAIAYVAGGSVLLARALVWPEKKKVGRVYGDAALLRRLLKDAGIPTNSNNESYDFMEGARILKVSLDNGLGTVRRKVPHYKALLNNGYNDIPELDAIYTEPDVVSPYIDGNSNALAPLDDKHLVITKHTSPNAKYLASNQDGYAHVVGRCPVCEGLKRWPNRFVKEFDLVGQPIFDEVCDECTNKIAFMCTRTHTYYDMDRFTQIKLYDYIVCFEANKDYIFQSSISSQWFLKDERIILGDKAFATSELITMEDTKWIEKHINKIGHK
jgi:hypothetical protein